MKFFILPGLKSFDGIIGNDSLKYLNATINIRDDIIRFGNGKEIKIKQKLSPTVNNIDVRTEHMTPSQKFHIHKLTNKYSQLFSDPNERLTYTTTVVGEIRTSSNTLVYTRYYPYPIGMRELSLRKSKPYSKMG